MVDVATPLATMRGSLTVNADLSVDRLSLSAFTVTVAAVTPKLLPPTLAVILAAPAVVLVNGAL